MLPKELYESLMRRGPLMGHCIRCGKWCDGHPVAAKIGFWRRLWRAILMIDGCVDVACWDCCQKIGLYRYDNGGTIGRANR